MIKLLFLCSFSLCLSVYLCCVFYLFHLIHFNLLLCWFDICFLLSDFSSAVHSFSMFLDPRSCVIFSLYFHLSISVGSSICSCISFLLTGFTFIFASYSLTFLFAVHSFFIFLDFRSRVSFRLYDYLSSFVKFPIYFTFTDLVFIFASHYLTFFPFHSFLVFLHLHSSFSLFISIFVSHYIALYSAFSFFLLLLHLRSSKYY